MIAFVLGGGGLLGASEVGMLQALFEAGVQPELVVGSSVGALNGAAIAAQPCLATAVRLADMWAELGTRDVFGAGLVGLGWLAAVLYLDAVMRGRFGGDKRAGM